jgi:hypothetical protein
VHVQPCASGTYEFKMYGHAFRHHALEWRSKSFAVNSGINSQMFLPRTSPRGLPTFSTAVPPALTQSSAAPELKMLRNAAN